MNDDAPTLIFERVKPVDEAQQLIDFIVADSYPFNSCPRPSAELIQGWIDTGFLDNAFWIMSHGQRAGIVHHESKVVLRTELHIRLHQEFRGQGLGKKAVAWLTDLVFQTDPAKRRVEGWTHAQNIAIHKVFNACGYTREALLRQDFPMGDGSYADKVGFAITRDDWQRLRERKHLEMTDPLRAKLSTTRERLAHAAQTLGDAGWEGAPSEQQIDLLSVEAVLRNHPAASPSALMSTLQAMGPIANAKNSEGGATGALGGQQPD